MIEYLIFYKFQILTGSLAGALAALIGVIVLLKRMTFFGITLAQAAAFSASIMLLLNANHLLYHLPLTILLILPFYYLIRLRDANREALLAVGFVLFTALSQVMLSFGGAVKNHLMTAYFGDILTISQERGMQIIPTILILALIIVLFYRLFISVSFDPDHATLRGVPVNPVEFLFFLLLSLVVGIGITLMGSFYTAAQLIIPGLVGLAFSRSVVMASTLAVAFSVLTALLGFLLSLVEIPFGASVIHLPTSSTIIVLMAAGSLILLFLKNRTTGKFL